jgi:hypothetical protein
VVTAADGLDDEGWGALVAQAGPPIYATSPWLAFLGDSVGGRHARFLARRDGRPVGGLAAMWVAGRGGLGSVVNALPWYGTPGACTLVDPHDDAARAALLGAFGETLRARPPLSATLVLTPEEMPHEADYRAALGATARDTRIGQVTPLPRRAAPTLEDMLALCGQKTRNLVRKALRQGFAVADEGDDDAAWAFLAETHAENMRAKGAAPKPVAHFEALRRHLPPVLRRLLVARDAGAPVAALLLAQHGETTEYLTPVVRVEHRARQPLSALIAHGLLDDLRAGRRAWNWGGTWHSQTTLMHFKAGFGAESRPYAYAIAASPEARETLRVHRDRLAGEFPFTYVYPYDGLRDASDGVPG